MSLRARFVSEIGYNLEHYELLKWYKEKWGNQLYILKEDTIESFLPYLINYETIPRDELNLPELKIKTVDKQYSQYRFNLNLKLNIKHDENEQEVLLENGDPYNLIPIAKRNAKLIAVGGHITTMKWLPQKLDDEQEHPDLSYLAIGVITGEDPDFKDINPTNLELNVFNNYSKTKNINSSIQIWEYNTTTNEFSLYKVLITSEFGAISDLDWAQLYTDDPTIGILSCVFKDGKVHLLRIEKDLPKYSVLENSSLVYTSDSNENKRSNLTCFSFNGTRTILAGTADGYVLEFELPFHYRSDDITKPNYKTFVTNGPISNMVSIKIPDQDNNYINIINGQGYKGNAYTTQNPISEVFAPVVERSSIKPTYNSLLRDIFLSHNLEYSNIISFRSLQDGITNMFQLDSWMTCAKMSEILSHPFLLIGTSNGEVILINYTRKFFSSRSRNKFLSPLIMWKFTLTVNKEKKKSIQCLNLNTNFFKSVVENSTPASFMPKEVMISSVAWNENVKGSSIYAAGTASGVLIVERLDPNFS
ncbi:uncharacterized protein KGF55_002639 [Candida pseudojiufengensis]|uniref:uncharacterized protein n=1 Tax=Candida pseudojiufengensis TaxID=497109 RepID=UPI002225475E|nr:uncharacterized protein KGF55_002639 [Candida pseudojiufengensis]KAI5963759.1 hypothetical protein KGF55_002639 [Candida pseudojiufengensis]